MKKCQIFIVFWFLPISILAQYIYLGHDGADCSSPMSINYTYTEYYQGSHGHGYRIYRNGIEVRHRYDEFGGYYVRSLDFLNDSVGFVTESFQGILFVYRTNDYGDNWECIGGANLEFHDIYFVNQHTAYLIGRQHHLQNSVTIVRILKDNRREVFSIDTVSHQIVYYNEGDTIMGEPLCQNQQNLTFEVQELGTTIAFCINYIHIISGVEDNKIVNAFRIFPNPAIDVLYFDIEDNQMLDISVYDYTGRLVKSSMVINKKLDISDLKRGLYILIGKNEINIYKALFIVE